MCFHLRSWQTYVTIQPYFPGESEELYYQRHCFLPLNAKVYILWVYRFSHWHAAKSFCGCLKKVWIHIHPHKLNLHYFFCVCVFQKSLWSTPQLWWAAQRTQQVSSVSLHLTHKFGCRTKSAKTDFSILLLYFTHTHKFGGMEINNK